MDDLVRVVHVITGLTTGGAEMMLYKILCRADRKRFAPSVVSLLGKGEIGADIEALGIPVHALEMGSPFMAPKVLSELALISRTTRPHLIQGWMYHGNLAASCAALFCCRPPVCWNIRQSLYSLSYEKRFTALTIRLGALGSFLPERIIYNAHLSVRHHEGIGYRGSKSVVIPNGFDCCHFRPDDAASRALRSELRLSDEAPLVGLVARYHPMKDHGNFLRAAAVLTQEEPSCHFILAGKGVDPDNAALGAMIRSFGLADRVHLLGERRDMARVTAALDVASSSSFAEAFPNVIGEAMACGVPCVVTDVGDSAMIVGDTGRVVPPRDPHALAVAWLELIRMGQERRRELGLKARQRICTAYSLDAVARQYEELYEHLVAGKG